MSGIQYPVDIKDIGKFEHQNNISVNVYGYEDKNMERCKLHGAQRINLPEADDEKGHDKIKFTKTEYQPRLYFVIYADFKSVL